MVTDSDQSPQGGTGSGDHCQSPPPQARTYTPKFNNFPKQCHYQGTCVVTSKPHRHGVIFPAYFLSGKVLVSGTRSELDLEAQVSVCYTSLQALWDGDCKASAVARNSTPEAAGGFQRTLEVLCVPGGRKENGHSLCSSYLVQPCVHTPQRIWWYLAMLVYMDLRRWSQLIF